MESRSAISPNLLASERQDLLLQFGMITVSEEQIPSNWVNLVHEIHVEPIPFVKGPCELAKGNAILINQIKQSIYPSQPSGIQRFSHNRSLGEIYMAMQYDHNHRYCVGMLMYKATKRR